MYNTELVDSMRATGGTGRDLNAELYPRVVAGDEDAIRRMIEANMAFVIGRVDAFVRARPQYEYLRDDLTSDAFVALTEAVRHFVGNRKESPNVTGYLSFWVNGAIKKSAGAETGLGMCSRTAQRKLEKKETIATTVAFDEDADEGFYCESGVEEIREALDAACTSDTDREIVRLRAAGFVDKEIADKLSLPLTKIFNLRKAIEKRYDQQ